MKKINGEKILMKLGLSTRKSKQYGKNLEEIIKEELKEELKEQKKEIKKKDVFEVKDTYKDNGDK